MIHEKLVQYVEIGEKRSTPVPEGSRGGGGGKSEALDMPNGERCNSMREVALWLNSNLSFKRDMNTGELIGVELNED